MKVDPPVAWTDEISVLFTSLWGWTPETWGTIGWTGNLGCAHRANLLNELSNPFITVCYATRNQTGTGPDQKGMIVGFYLISHEMGDRDDFTHPIHHKLSPKDWRHSLRAIRAFSYLPEYRHRAKDKISSLPTKARSISRWGEIITDRSVIDGFRSTPWVEVEVYSSRNIGNDPRSNNEILSGMVLPGPDSSGGYEVPASGPLPRDLYVLRLTGDTNAYLGWQSTGRSIYKIGLSASPEFRRHTFQKAMPKGQFLWAVERTTRMDGDAPYSFSAAENGETAMKVHLARCSKNLGGEFYLASDEVIETAWAVGREAALAFKQKG